MLPVEIYISFRKFQQGEKVPDKADEGSFLSALLRHSKSPKYQTQKTLLSFFKKESSKEKISAKEKGTSAKKP